MEWDLGFDTIGCPNEDFRNIQCATAPALCRTLCLLLTRCLWQVLRRDAQQEPPEGPRLHGHRLGWNLQGADPHGGGVVALCPQRHAVVQRDLPAAPLRTTWPATSGAIEELQRVAVSRNKNVS